MLTYTLGGTDASSFSIVSTSGQLQTSAALNYESKSSYSVSVSVSDSNGGSDSIAVTISVTNVNEKPSFSISGRGTLSVAENTVSGTNIGAPFQATGDFAETLYYTLWGGDKDAFRIDGDTGQLRTHAILDYETKNAYTDLTVRAVLATNQHFWEGSTRVTINVTDVAEDDAPVFIEGSSATRAVAENTDSGTNIGIVVAATADAGDTLTYSLSGTDAASFSIVSTTGQLQTSAALDYETKNAYVVTVSVSDGEGGSDSISVTINVTNVWEYPTPEQNRHPTFTEGRSTRRAVAENTASGQNIGAPVSATDANRYDDLTYTLGGTDAAAFDVGWKSGQLLTKAALDFETKNSYTVTVTAYDGNSGADRITVTINVTDVAGAAPSLETSPVIPDNTALLTNFPNPFNPETWIPYQLAEPADVTLTIYDIHGRIVRTLRLGHQPAGFYQSRSKAAHWDGRNHLGEKVATGVYFYTLKAGDYMATRKLLIRK